MRSWGLLPCCSSTGITSCCSVIMLQGCVHSPWSWKHPCSRMAWALSANVTHPIDWHARLYVLVPATMQIQRGGGDQQGTVCSLQGPRQITHRGENEGFSLRRTSFAALSATPSLILCISSALFQQLCNEHPSPFDFSFSTRKGQTWLHNSAPICDV